jgi:hypothetical protein
MALMAEPSIKSVQKELQALREDVEYLKSVVAEDYDLSDEAKKRLAQVRKNPSIGKTEKELDTYLKKRGVKLG